MHQESFVKNDNSIIVKGEGKIKLSKRGQEA